MLSINISDVITVLRDLKSYLIVVGVVAILALVVSIACRKADKSKKFLIRAEAGIALLLCVAIVANLICTGPMSTVLSLVSGNGVISDETSTKAQALGLEIAEEGIVVLENDDNILPLNRTTNLNVFGWASTNPVYGGTGSGSLSTAYETVSLLQGLENAGFSLNTDLSDLYTQYCASRPSVGMWTQDWTLPEPTVESYTDEMLNDARAFSDTALIVISRPGGEHIDLPRDLTNLKPTIWGSTVDLRNNSTEYEDFPAGTHYLELSQTERRMVDMVCSNFDNVVLVYNGANTLELDFVQDYSEIKGVIWCPGTGQNGFDSLGRILNGEVNPSGKTTDTFVADLTATPTWNNFGENAYENMNEFTIADDDPFVPGNVPHFVNYVEGIYVGYKFYETAAEEGLIDYDRTVLYPFGYGLSYTSFTQEMGPITESNGTIKFDVTVTNTGSVAGKDVVEAYYNPPYTNGGIEKASANLIAFDKTDMLEPGASQTMTISFDAEDMASFDTYGTGYYVLEAGDYSISIRSDSHHIIAEQNYTVPSTIVYDENNTHDGDLIAATSQFGFAEGTAGSVTYLSRADGFANYASAVAAPASHNMAEADKAVFVNNSNFVPDNDPNAVMPTIGAKNNMTLADVRGLDYDDPQWEKLLDQLTISDMVDIIALGGYQTAPAESVGKVRTIDCDGPASINNNFTRVGSIGYPCGVMIANTWNEDLAYEFGEWIGTMADEMDVSGWYAPAMNIHRSAFAGRNFEYYSEDPLLSGRIAVQAVRGSDSKGVYAYIKHFALNDQETNRWQMLCTWSTEQAIREIYLKPFEICVKEANTTAVMSSYNYIGTQWAGACNALLNTVLRDEWGYVGMVETDYFANFGYMDATRGIYNGCDFCLSAVNYETNFVTDTNNPVTVQKMRTACHNVLYTTANSRAHSPENISSGLMSWQIILIAADVILAAAVIALEFVIFKSFRKKAQNN